MELNLLAQSDLKLLNLIDWQLITSRIAQNSYFKMNKEKIQSVPRKKSKNDVIQAYQLLEKSIKYIDSEHYHQFYQNLQNLDWKININQFQKKIEKENVLSIMEIHQIIVLFETFHQNSILFSDLFEKKHLENLEIQSIYSKLVRPFRQFVDYDGKIDYENHPKLKPLFLKRNALDLKAKETLSRLIQEYSQKEILQINTYDIYNDHYVLLIKTDHYSKNLGFIHARSDTGQTLYIEPKSLAKISDQRKDLSIEIEANIFNICKDFTKILSVFEKETSKISKMIFSCDYVFSMGKFSKDHDLRRPIIDEKENFWIEDFHHPFIEDPVKNNIEIKKSSQGIMISGPNTGGKTLSLKSICLTCLFPHIGLFIPARNATIPLFDEIYFLSQDHQNLEEGLSSFAAESKNYLHLANNLSQNAVIFIDEIFNSTSSEEASALALGFFDYFKQKSNPLIFVSTHHQMLKVKTHEHQNFLSSHVGFNPETGLPTYKLFYDSPGSSRAIEIFEYLSKDFQFGGNIINEAKKILDKKQLDYENLLAEVSKKKALLDQELKKEKELNDQLNNQLKAQEGVLKLKTKEEIEKLREEVKRIKKKSYDLLDNIKKGKISSVKTVDKKIAEISNEPILEQKEEAMYSSQKVTPITGHNYIYKPLRKIGKALKVDEDDKKVLLSFSNNFKIEADFDDLAFGPGGKPNTPSKFTFSYTKNRNEKFILDARGMRLDEFKNEVELMVSDLFANNLPYVEIIHGHGNGILKNWLRSFIAKNSDLEIEIPKDSGDGITRIRLSK